MESESFSMSLSRSLTRLSSKKSQKEAMNQAKKPRNLVALGIFVVLISRVVYNHIKEWRLQGDLLRSFDPNHDDKLTPSELTALLDANGLKLKVDQVKSLFNKVDDEGDGFDRGELDTVLEIVAALPSISEKLRVAATSSNSILYDLGFIAICGGALFFLVNETDGLEKKWAASAFRGAVQFRRMQAKVTKLDTDLKTYDSEKEKLQGMIKELEEKSPKKGEMEERQREISRLKSEVEEIEKKEEEIKLQLQAEVSRWQAEAERSMREAHNTKTKMERMMMCIKGLDAFAGKGGGNFSDHGAQQGFSVSQRAVGFSSDTITFGTIESGKLLLFETSSANKIGDGKDGAYRCRELETGTDFALKMYRITNPDQRKSIFHDLYAHMSQVGKHKRIVSYERVIESESNIFVLMELLKGKDLFDTVVENRLTEIQARTLFRHLVEALNHIHRNHVIHCDVKPENAFVCGSLKDGTAHLKLIDFGCSCFTQYEQDQGGCVVWDSYMPPEHTSNRGLAPAIPTDMWRLGCTLYVMLVQAPPFANDAHTPAGLDVRQRGGFPRTQQYNSLSSEARDLIEKLIQADPAKRLTTDEVLNHPWLADTANGTN